MDASNGDDLRNPELNPLQERDLANRIDPSEGFEIVDALPGEDDPDDGYETESPEPEEDADELDDQDVGSGVGQGYRAGAENIRQLEALDEPALSEADPEVAAPEDGE